VADYVIKNNLSYDFLVKLHSKKSLHTADADTGVTWRTEAYNTLAGSPAITKGIIKLMTAHPEIGMAGSTVWNIYTKTNQLMGYGHNYATIKSLAKEFGLKADVDNFNFIAGTMFWADYESLLKPLRTINIPAFISRMEPNAANDSRKSTLTHSMERMFALFIISGHKKVVGI
jgi:lipopolysaccharide biosynthesis protein